MLFSWGDGTNGKLGMGDEMKVQPVPLQLPQSPQAVVDVACGDFHSCCLTGISSPLTFYFILYFIHSICLFLMFYCRKWGFVYLGCGGLWAAGARVCCDSI